MEPISVGGLVVHRDVVPHPLLGEAQLVEYEGRTLTAMSPLDWERPTQIPTIAEPGRLPPGSGGALMNLIAERALAAGVYTLRYAGPYPTPALYRTLLRSFRTSADEATFTADVLGRAMRVARDELPIDFRPAPHRRVAHAHGVSEVRDGLERTTIDGIAYERDGSPARLVEGAAEVWFGDALWARVARFTEDGLLVDGPHRIPPPSQDIVGREFPPQLRAALAELVAELVPSPLATDAAAMLAQREIVWADLGARAARAAAQRFEVHAALWERIAPLGLARVALALAEALAPVVTTTLLAAVQASSSRPSP
ncbi:MAG: hypothetical protein HOV81_17275 [Kofleriaceae bacterium]|nr:hypothetical protein [Kofleriaceae bacterium]